MVDIKKAAVGLGLAGSIMASPEEAKSQEYSDDFPKRINADTTIVAYPYDNTKPGEISFSDKASNAYVISISEINNSLQNPDCQSPVIKEFKSSMLDRVKDIGVTFIDSNEADADTKKSSKGGYYYEENKLFSNIENKNFFDEKNTPEINMIHEYTHLLNNEKFPKQLSKALTPENVQTHKILDESMAMAVANTVRDNQNNLNLTKEQFRDSTTKHMADYYSKFLYAPDIYDQSYINSANLRSATNVSTPSSPLYNNDYKEFSNVKPEIFTKYLTDRYSKIVPGFDLIDDKKFIERVEKNREKFLENDKDLEWQKNGKSTTFLKNLKATYNRYSRYVKTGNEIKQKISEEGKLKNGSLKQRRARLKIAKQCAKLTSKAARDTAEFSTQTTKFDSKYNPYIADLINFSRKHKVDTNSNSNNNENNKAVIRRKESERE